MKESSNIELEVLRDLTHAVRTQLVSTEQRIDSLTGYKVHLEAFLNQMNNVINYYEGEQ